MDDGALQTSSAVASGGRERSVAEGCSIMPEC